MGSENQMQTSQLNQEGRNYAGEWKISIPIYQKVKMIRLIHDISKIWKEQHNLHKEIRGKSVISILMNKTSAQRICQIKDFNSRLFTFVLWGTGTVALLVCICPHHWEMHFSWVFLGILEFHVYKYLNQRVRIISE